MKHSFVHGMSLEKARAVAESAWRSYSSRFEKYRPSIEWIDGYRARIGFSAKGIKLKGELEIKPDLIEIAIDTPLIFRLWKKKAINAIEKEIRSWESRGQQEN